MSFLLDARWSTPVLWLGVTVIIVGFVADLVIDSKRVELAHELSVRREVYWGTWMAGALICGVSQLHRGGVAVLGIIGGIMLLAVLNAIRRTPFLKIRGRVIASSATDRREGRPAELPLWLRELQEQERRERAARERDVN